MSLVVCICQLCDALRATDRSTCAPRVPLRTLSRASSALQHPSRRKIDEPNHSSPPPRYPADANFAPLLPNQNPEDRRRLSSTPLFPDA